jgi:hypothetical protein
MSLNFEGYFVNSSVRPIGTGLLAGAERTPPRKSIAVGLILLLSPRAKVGGGAGSRSTVLNASPAVTRSMRRRFVSSQFEPLGAALSAHLLRLLASVTTVPNGGEPKGNCNVVSGGVASGANRANCTLLPPAADAKP